jgi:hypothetical protein
VDKVVVLIDGKKMTAPTRTHHFHAENAQRLFARGAYRFCMVSAMEMAQARMHAFTQKHYCAGGVPIKCPSRRRFVRFLEERFPIEDKCNKDNRHVPRTFLMNLGLISHF